MPLIQQDYIMLIMNCKKYAKKALYQKRTWLKKLPSYLIYFHVIGDETLATDFEFDHDNHILWVKTADDYNSLPKKVIAAYSATLQQYSFKYIFKTDDDQILVNDKYFDVIVGILNKTPKIHYGGFIVDVKQDHLSKYHLLHPELPEFLPIRKSRYCSGRFYFLSSQAIINVLTKRNAIEKEYFEDYAIGYHLEPHYKLNMLNIRTNDYFTDIELSDYPKILSEGLI